MRDIVYAQGWSRHIYQLHSPPSHFSFCINNAEGDHFEFISSFLSTAVSLSEDRGSKIILYYLWRLLQNWTQKGLGSKILFLMLIQTINVNQDMHYLFPYLSSLNLFYFFLNYLSEILEYWAMIFMFCSFSLLGCLLPRYLQNSLTHMLRYFIQCLFLNGHSISHAHKLQIPNSAYLDLFSPAALTAISSKCTLLICLFSFCT